MGHSKKNDLDLYYGAGNENDMNQLADCLEAVKRREFYPCDYGYVTVKTEAAIQLFRLLVAACVRIVH